MNTQLHLTRSRARLSIFLAALSISTLVASSHAGNGPAIQFRKVAETGMSAPGTEPGVVFGALTTGLSHDLLVPKIDEAGRVAFMAMLAGPGIDVSNFQGMWAEQDGQLELVARGGMPAPDTEEGTHFVGVPSLEFPFPPEFGGGRTGFHAELAGLTLDVTNDEGFWAGTPGNVRLVAREGAPAPDLPGLTFGIPFGSVNRAGHAFMRNDVSGPGVDDTNRSALFTDRSGSLELFLREGDPAPFTEPGTVFGGIIPFRAFTLNARANFAISAKVEGPSVDPLHDEMLYVERDGALQLVLRESDTAPGAGPGVTFGGNVSDLSLGFVEMNDNERVAFLIGIGGASPTRTAVFSDHAGELTAVALPDQPAPGTDFDYSLFATPTLNNADRIAFGVAFPHDGGPFTPAPFGVFSDLNGSIAPVVSPGDTTLDGEIIDDARIFGFNAAGQMLLNLRIVSETFRTGFWLRDTDGTLHRLAAIGDIFDVDGDGFDLREVIRVVTGGLNEAGRAALRLDFADDSSAHFVASLSAACTNTCGDIDASGGNIDLQDFASFAVCFGQSASSSTACKCSDLNADGTINLLDFATFSLNFGATSTNSPPNCP